MGLLARSLATFAKAAIPQAVASLVPTWDAGNPISPTSSYYRNATEGYGLDELVYQCIELRANAAGEPPIAAWQATASGEEKLGDGDEHPALTLLNSPNPFMGHAEFWGAVDMCEDIGGNAYIEIVRSASGKPVELWPLRPDRIRVIPDAKRFIRAYRYTIGNLEPVDLDADDVIHFKTRHPLNDYEGLAPLAVLAGRVDLDIWTRRFNEAFFRNAGVPAGLLNLVTKLTETDRTAVQRRFREVYGGSEGWHKIMVLDGNQATYTPMGLNLGENGLAMKGTVQTNEVRILGQYGVPPSLIPTLVGMEGNRGNTSAVSDRELFMQQTMVPWWTRHDSVLNAKLIKEWPDLKRIGHDLSKVKALQEDVDKVHARWREDWLAGNCTWEEYRQGTGKPEKPDKAGMVIIPVNMILTWSDDLLKEPEPEPVPALPVDPNADNPELAGSKPALPAPAQPAAAGRSNGRTNGATH